MDTVDMKTSPGYVVSAERWVRDLNLDLESYFTDSTEQLEYAYDHEFSSGVFVNVFWSDFVDGRIVSADVKMVVQYSVSKGWFVVV